MDHQHIKADLQELVSAMIEKGIKQADATMDIKANSVGNIVLWCSCEARQLSGDYMRFFYGDTPEEQIEAARGFIAALPDPAKEGERLFTRKLAEAVDIATEYSLPDAVVTPVRVAIREVNAALLPGAA
ncbi:MAG: hypothetical protein QM594_10085 [Niabella sp.]